MKDVLTGAHNALMPARVKPLMVQQSYRNRAERPLFHGLPAVVPCMSAMPVEPSAQTARVSHKSDE